MNGHGAIESIAATISQTGAVLYPGTYLRSLLSAAELDQFLGYWNDLGADNYLPDKATYRRRRYGRLSAKPQPEGSYSLETLGFLEFQQAADLIPLYAGKPRNFEQIQAVVLSSPILTTLIHADLAVISSSEGSRHHFIIGVHMIRIVVNPRLARFPAPEGRHSDGHNYVAMHLMNKKDCEGGDSQIFYPGNFDPILEIALTETLDTLFVDDRRVEHAVTAVRALGREGTRDMLLIDFDVDH